MAAKPPARFDFSPIDTHVHLWRYASPWMTWLADRPASWDVVRRDFAWDDLHAVLQAAGIDELILMQACTTPAETRFLLEVAEARPRVRGVVGWVSLAGLAATEADLAALEGVGREKLVGVRNNHGWAPDHDVIVRPQAAASCRLIADLGLTMDLHVPDYTALPAMQAVIERTAGGVFVIDHLGKPKLDDPDAFAPWAQAIDALSRLPSVYLKYSGWATFIGRARADDVRRYVDHALQAFGPERMMYASNWPVALVADSYAQTWAATLEAAPGLDATGWRHLLRQTALRCYLGED